MPKPSIDRRKPALATVLILILACLGLAACGGSSSSTGSTASTATTASAASATSTTPTASTPTNPTTATAPGSKGLGARNSGRFAALRACLQKEGITLPQRTPGTRRPGGGGLLGGGGNGGPQLPKGVTRSQLQNAMRKCGGGAGFGGAPGESRPQALQALTKFTACMRANGVKLPTPNTSGKGPVFKTQGLNATGEPFKAADMKCQSDLRGNFRRVPPHGGAGSGTPGGENAQPKENN